MCKVFLGHSCGCTCGHGSCWSLVRGGAIGGPKCTPQPPPPTHPALTPHAAFVSCAHPHRTRELLFSSPCYATPLSRPPVSSRAHQAMLSHVPAFDDLHAGHDALGCSGTCPHRCALVPEGGNASWTSPLSPNVSVAHACAAECHLACLRAETYQSALLDALEVHDPLLSDHQTGVLGGSRRTQQRRLVYLARLLDIRIGMNFQRVDKCVAQGVGQGNGWGVG